MSSVLDLFTAATSPVVIDTVIVPEKGERLLPLPEPFNSGSTGAWAIAKFGASGQVWRHQALALESLAAGKHVVVSTATASGKSAVFQTAMLHEMLEGHGTVIVLYPTKALSGDQFTRTKADLTRAGLPEHLVAELNGDVPSAERELLAQRARIILMTPDCLQSWGMPSMAGDIFGNFGARLRFLVIDEAHLLDGGFGTQCAYLIRRLRSVRAKAAKRLGFCPKLQIIAASATISRPEVHLQALTGCPFVAVTEDDNGAPSPGMTLLHVEAPAGGTRGERAFAKAIELLAGSAPPDALIAFADSRQGVEHITRYVGRDDIPPYRSGYEAFDRRQIEHRMRGRELAGVITTSALEVGIDMPQFTFGLNLNIPMSRKAFRQRAGRVGRVKPGLFVIYAPRAAFAQLGTTLREFYEGAAEPSHVYLENRIIQWQNARCIVAELGGADGSVVLSADVEWPAGFREMVVNAQPGGSRPRDVEQIAWMEGDSPHRSFPLRRISERTYALKVVGSNHVLGTIELDKALREAAPGKTYFHMRKPYRVIDWRTTAFENVILLEPAKNVEITHALLRTSANISEAKEDRLNGHYIASDKGSLSEECLRIHETVEGYSVGNKSFLYRDLCKTDRRLFRKQRELATTGVIVRINEPWFSGTGDAQRELRRAFAEALMAVASRECSIAPSDIRFVHCNIAICGQGGAKKIEDAVVIFDNVIGGLRLTAPVFERAADLLERLDRASTLAGTQALLSADTVGRLMKWYEGLSPAQGSSAAVSSIPDGDLLIFAPESEVGVRIRGVLHERKLLEPQLLETGDGECLMYRYEASPGVSAFVAHSRVEPVGQNWRRAIWTPRTNHIRALAA